MVPTDVSTPTRLQAHGTLAMLSIVYALSYMDRQVIVILQEPIKRELALADWQLGLLTGFAFAVFYAIMGVPIARLADRGSRRTIVSVSLAVWSVMTAMCGLATSYWQLLLARIGVGAGEAGCSPPAHSMISDLYPPQARALAISIYSLGPYLGILFGYIGGGYIYGYFGWRRTLFLLAIPGLLYAIVFRILVPEPRRTGLLKSERDAPPSTKEVLGKLWALRSFRHLAIACGLHGLVTFGIASWLPSFFIRTHGLDPQTVGPMLAPVSAFAGAIGIFGGGWLCSRMGRRDPRWNIWLPTIAIVVSIPLLLVVYLLADYRVAIIIYILPMILGAAYWGPAVAVTYSLIGSRMRAVASSILILFTNLIGLGIGPWMIGVLSDWFQPEYGALSLRQGLIIVTVLANSWAAFHYLYAAKWLRADMDRVGQQA